MFQIYQLNCSLEAFFCILNVFHCLQPCSERYVHNNMEFVYVCCSHWNSVTPVAEVILIREIFVFKKVEVTRTCFIYIYIFRNQYSVTEQNFVYDKFIKNIWNRTLVILKLVFQWSRRWSLWLIILCKKGIGYCLKDLNNKL